MESSQPGSGLWVGIKDLRDGLSRYLERVRNGGTITVTDHGRPVARIVPVGRLSTYEQMKLDGRITPPRRPKGTTRARADRDSGSGQRVHFRAARTGRRRAVRVIGYLDTSAFVPIMLVAESTSAACLDFWLAADAVVSTRLLYVETASALARGERGGRLIGDQPRRARDLFDDLFVEVGLIDVDERLVRGGRRSRPPVRTPRLRRRPLRGRRTARRAGPRGSERRPAPAGGLVRARRRHLRPGPLRLTRAHPTGLSGSCPIDISRYRQCASPAVGSRSSRRCSVMR